MFTDRWINLQMTDPEVHRQKSVLSRLAVKSLFDSSFDGALTVPSKTDPIRLEVPKSTQVDLLGSTAQSKRMHM